MTAAKDRAVPPGWRHCPRPDRVLGVDRAAQLESPSWTYYLEPARQLGMGTVHAVGPETTVKELSRLFNADRTT
ncbi:hypothetical protein [Nocardia sp. CNY236]|uniref:hypothetical protein n=1 Tax=Nocardia sp. CNY236 TaxID=1169152 RepID=UPI000402109F|nr:hypothetical protein [Nocardia sp. CNY236]